MTRILLIRHAMCDPVGKWIAGREPGVRLNAEGRHQAELLAERLAADAIVAIYSSPMERALETAAPIAERLALPVHEHPGLHELDFGGWTGRTLQSLEGDPIWRAFNERRGATRIPGGESMAEVQARAMAGLAEIADRHPDATVAAVTHGDVVRAVLLGVLGAPLDRIHALEILPASVSVLRRSRRELVVVSSGETAHLERRGRLVGAS